MILLLSGPLCSKSYSIEPESGRDCARPDIEWVLAEFISNEELPVEDAVYYMNYQAQISGGQELQQALTVA